MLDNIPCKTCTHPYKIHKLGLYQDRIFRSKSNTCFAYIGSHRGTAAIFCDCLDYKADNLKYLEDKYEQSR